MWCRHCQQDVPAIAQPQAAAPVCPRCESALPRPAALATPDDAGIELDAFESIEFEPVEQRASEILDAEQLETSLRELGRRLGRRDAIESRYIAEASYNEPAYSRPTALTLLQQPPASRVVPTVVQTNDEVNSRTAPPSYRAQRTAAAWWLTALLFTSVVFLIAGVAVLAWTAAFPSPLVWQNALTATLAGEGGLIVGLAWMAARLWHNSRRVNRQLAGVDRQLDELQLAAERRPYDLNYYRRVA